MPALDSLGVFDSLLAFPKQCRQVIAEVSQQHIPAECFLAENVVIAGMGGSALGGRIISSLEKQTLKIPFLISTEFHLPNFVGPNSLVVISSYSGNTAETISALNEALARKARIYVIATGGQLIELAQKYSLPHYHINPIHNPSSQPRMGLGYNIVALLTLLSRCQLIHPAHDLGRLPEFLTARQHDIQKWKTIADRLTGRIPVVIAGEHLKGSAIAMRNQFHENSKTFAVFFDLPEANHHLLEGLSYPKSIADQLAFLFVASTKYHEELSRRFKLTAQAFQKQSFPVLTLPVEGSSRLFEALDLVQAGGFLAFYLAQNNVIDPGPIPWVDWYKDEIR